MFAYIRMVGSMFPEYGHRVNCANRFWRTFAVFVRTCLFMYVSTTGSFGGVRDAALENLANDS